MSHKATNWAVSVRGIPPTAKVVLWHLADRHNKDTGQCNPSQERLADDCEISRSSLNNQLRVLEKAGLIERHSGVDPKTKRQRPTHYILHMDRSKPQEPCPKSAHGAVSNLKTEPCPISRQSRVQILDTNPVREPGKEPTPLSPQGGPDEILNFSKRKAGVPDGVVASLKAKGLVG